MALAHTYDAPKRDRLDGEFRYILRQSPGLNDAERALLSYVSSYAGGCWLKYDQVCEVLGWSRSKLKRVVQLLVDKGLLHRTYREYKRTTLKIAPANIQAQFASDQRENLNKTRANDGSPVDHESWPTGEPLMAHPWTDDGSPVGHSTYSTNSERKEESVPVAGKAGGQEPPKPVQALAWLADAIQKRREAEVSLAPPPQAPKPPRGTRSRAAGPRSVSAPPRLMTGLSAFQDPAPRLV